MTFYGGTPLTRKSDRPCSVPEGWVGHLVHLSNPQAPRGTLRYLNQVNKESDNRLSSEKKRESKKAYRKREASEALLLL